MSSAEEFLRECGAGQVRISDEVVLKLLMVLVACSTVAGAEAQKLDAKPPLQVDGSFEFYASILVCGLAMLAVWEFLKWVVPKLCCQRDEAAIFRARRLLRIRGQTARALRQELAALTPEAPLDEDEGEHQASSTGTSVYSPNHPDHVGGHDPVGQDHTVLGPNDVTEAEARRRNYTFRCLPPPFVMSEHGDRIHVRPECFGLRNANRAKLRRIPYCTCCAAKYPLYYRTPDGDPLLG